ncbi:glycosyltransferase [Roseiflexus castenholzii]|uniref:Glycosyl transferase family 2 n=1 Tax=Roseiflexus castenholzii (strain DSM 13941 / HLO8) TaxID=383372 RepID=A7NQ51_ROSCS|nr:glycosyltransferase [Roseiflexus castenholzii]ABU59697.1 glycosyl transferase family 2 [Roseiflexus castenholzii DSM 13941]
MNLWLLTSQFPPAVIGGIARYVANAADMFARAGHRVTVVTVDQTEGEEVLPSGVRVLRFVPRGRAFAPYVAKDATDHNPAFPYNIMAYPIALSYELAERVSSYVQRDGVLPDMIECQEYLALPYYLIQRRLVERHPLGDVPLLLHLHSPDFCITRANRQPRYRLPGYWIGRMERFCMHAADAMLSPSFFLANQIAGEMMQLSHAIEVVPYPYLPLPALETMPERGDLVFFGRLEPRKGVMEFVGVCDHLWSRGYDFRLTLIGDDTPFGPRGMSVGAWLRWRYGRRIDEGRLIMTGASLPPEDLWRRLEKAWAVVVPSTWENYPNVCIEAMALGKLVIASTSGGQAEMIGADGDCGILFRWDQPGDCVAAVERALALSVDEVRAIGARARDRITALTSFEAVLPRRMAHFEQITTCMRPRRSFPGLMPDVPAPMRTVTPDTVPGLLSVVVPYHNLGAYLAETIASIVASSYRPLDIVIVDDGSDDPASVAALEQVGQMHPDLVRIVRCERGGLARARNRGAQAARGEFLAFVDADDLVEPSFFERAIDVLQRYDNVSFVYSWVRFFGESDACWPTWNVEFPYLLAHNMLTAFVVVRRSDFLAWGQNDPSLSDALEDYDAWISMVEQGCIGVSLPDPLVRYRMRSDSMYHSLSDAQILEMYDRIVARHRSVYERYGAELFALQNENGPGWRWNHPATDPPDVVQHQQIAALQHRVARLERLLAIPLRVRRTLRDLWRRQR